MEKGTKWEEEGWRIDQTLLFNFQVFHFLNIEFENRRLNLGDITQ